MCDLVDLDVLRHCHTGGLTSNFQPGVGKLTVFNTWLVLSSPLCPGRRGWGRAWLQMTEALKSEELSLTGQGLLSFIELKTFRNVTGYSISIVNISKQDGGSITGEILHRLDYSSVYYGRPLPPKIQRM